MRITTMTTSPKNLVLFKNHRKTEVSDYLLQKLYYELDSNDYDIIELYDATDKEKKIGALNFTYEDIINLNYILADDSVLNYFVPTWLPKNYKSKQIWYNAEYPIFYALDFLKKNSEINIDYKYIWSIEYDTYYSGNWDNLFEEYEKDDTDFIGTYNTYYPNVMPFTSFWGLCKNSRINDIDKANSFGCFYRVSTRLVDKIRSELEKGHHSYCEQTFITLAKHFGMSIKDLNETKANYHFATTNGELNNTLKKWISENKCILENKLFHPVRDFDIIKLFEKED